jgi:hypothetical protein
VATELIVPSAIEVVIKRFDQSNAALDEHDVKHALIEARTTLSNPTDTEHLGAWSEVLAFALEGNARQQSPWNTYFGPNSSGVHQDGRQLYFPDIAGTEGLAVAHWAQRAQELKHPVLKARYADLAWDMSRAIAKTNPDPIMARMAIDAYLASLAAKLRVDDHSYFNAAIRALDLAVMIRDEPRINSSRETLLQQHRDAMAEERGMWWLAVDRLMDDKRAGLTDVERDQLIADMEGLLTRFSNSADPTGFDPHATEGVGRRLIKYYNKAGKRDDTKRLHEVIARAFEHFASLGGAMIASWALQTAINAYRDAGLTKESRRLRIVMEEKIEQSQDEMVPIRTETAIPREDMESYIQTIVTSDLGETFARLAVSFIDRRADMEKVVQASLEEAPLAARVGQTIMAKNHIAAKVGSVEDDPFGRLVRQAAQAASLSDVWLVNVFNRAIETHGVTPGHFASWAARAGLFDDLTLLIEGVRAWFDQDYIKAVHVLVPQVEHGLRGIVSMLDLPVTKPHPTISGVSVAINMGDILYSKEITEALGPDLTLYFLTLYADPRGFNLRNNIAHGLMEADRIGYGVATRVIHTLLVLGLWKEIAKARR